MERLMRGRKKIERKREERGRVKGQIERIVMESMEDQWCEGNRKENKG